MNSIVKIRLIYDIGKVNGKDGFVVTAHDARTFPAINIWRYAGETLQEVQNQAQDFLDNYEFDYKLTVIYAVGVTARKLIKEWEKENAK